MEELTGGDPEAAVYENARRKATAVARGADERVLGVDTEVLIDERLLGKAGGPHEARASLELLSGRTHSVLSGLCLLEGDTERGGVAETHVTFRTLPPELVDWYVATGEWAGRAGAYAIQGHGAALVARIDGDYWNVVGLPVPLLLELAPELVVPGA